MGVINRSQQSATSGSGIGSNIVTPAAASINRSLTLAQSDFILTPIKAKLQSVCLIFGDAGTGKTTFVTRYCPEPIAFFSFDGRANNAIKKAQDSGRVIYPTYIDYPADVMRLKDDEARRVGQIGIDKLIRNLEIAVAESLRGNINTIAVDTGTEYGELITMAARGRLDKAPKDFGDSKNLINRQWWRLFNLARAGNANLVVLSRAKAIWEGNAPTGNFTYRCHDVVYDAVDWAGHIRLRKFKGKLKQEFQLEITKAGNNIVELGEVYTKDDWEDLGGPFAYASMLQYEGSMDTDWR